jgi:hypothetical protein
MLRRTALKATAASLLLAGLFAPAAAADSPGVTANEIKIAILYQNDDLGKDLINGFRSEMKDTFDSKVVAAAYQVGQPPIDFQIVPLKSSGANIFLFADTPKFAAHGRRSEIE